VSVGDVLDKVGTELFRLWVSSINYQDDIPTSIDQIKGAGDEYRRIRNTFRILLGNLANFDPARDQVDADALEPIDRWILTELRTLVERCLAAYDAYTFHRVFSTVHNFCTVQLSNIYVDVLKDRMYCDVADSPRRRSAQTAMYQVLDALTRLLAPILVHTTEQVWDHMPGTRAEESVHLAPMPDPSALPSDEAFEAEWAKLIRIRDAVLPHIQTRRYDKKRHSPEEIESKGLVGSSQEVEILLKATGATRDFIERGRSQLADLLIVSGVELVEEIEAEGTLTFPAADDLEDVQVAVRRTTRPRCPRCWNFRDTVGQSADHADLCDRCAEVVSGQ
jgi:isoleucyl-tRNA synthetase